MELKVAAVLKRGEALRSANADMVKRLKKSRPRDLDNQVQSLHDQAFESIDCLQCANCCKTTSPGMNDRDIDRLAKHLRMKPAQLIAQHMELDTDGQYVFRSAPCPFLGKDNYCSVYDSRPTACREYPHTNRRRFYQLLDLSLKNTEVCPAVVRIFDGLRSKYGIKM